MTPGWENVRIGLADSYQHKPRWETWRTRQFWYCVAVSLALWFLIGVVIFG